jgi:excisionase family DNA binding protein
LNGSPYLLVEDVAELLHCSTRTVREHVRLNEIPHRKPSGARRILFLEAELRAWLDGAPLEVTRLPRGGRAVRPKAVRL